MVGDACNMSQFVTQEFDVVFSNSVIEHVGSRDNQRRMADEIRRVGCRYFVQTPNRNFLLEPHSVFPFFQFLPLLVRLWLVSRFRLGWYGRMTRDEAKRDVQMTHLLDRHELMLLFPEGELYEERFVGLVKSFIVYDGWVKK
jgi:hypothetical protein